MVLSAYTTYSVYRLHTLWHRQHNRIAGQLHETNRHWSSEKVFEESRRIVIAQIQHITYTEFLPPVIGYDLVR